MTSQSSLHVAMDYVKEYAAAIIAAALMYAGIHQVISVFSQPLAMGIIGLINAISRRGFHGVTLLPEFSGIPWLFFTRVLAIGVIVIVVGILVGLWANSRSQRQLPGETLPEIQK
jgi:hypothetical protein